MVPLAVVQIRGDYLGFLTHATGLMLLRSDGQGAIVQKNIQCPAVLAAFLPVASVHQVVLAGLGGIEPQGEAAPGLILAVTERAESVYIHRSVPIELNGSSGLSF